MRRHGILACAVLFLTAGAAAATEAEGELNIFAGDIGNMIWTVLIFGLVLFVLGKFAWGPLLATLNDRESFIRDSLAQAKEDREAAAARLAEYTAKLEEARAEASAIVAEGRRDAEVAKAKIGEEARHEAQTLLDRAKREIEVAKTTAIRELYERSASLAMDVATRVLRREVSAGDHERLIAEALTEIGDRDLN
ncbi:MAG: F0F1 ATP synthase subunit B [Acidobacteriota bacterium]|nr:F0F1 ATP synthase subunit B [Acidobacteriota bacterium]MDH3525090.1 F0F1 ATP synthase subunit B [Acidobacteriota bacterium]